MGMGGRSGGGGSGRVENVSVQRAWRYLEGHFSYLPSREDARCREQKRIPI